MTEPHTLAGYVRHARKFGTEMVFTTFALESRNPHELAELVRELRAIDAKRRRFAAPAAATLAHRLVIEGYSEAAACRTARIDRWTFRRTRSPIGRRSSSGTRTAPTGHR